MTRTEIKKRIQADSEVQKLFASAKEKFGAYQQHLRDNDDLLDPFAAKKRHDQLIGQAKTSEELRATVAMRAEIEAQTDDTRRSAIRIARKAYAPVSDALKTLASRCRTLLDGFVADAVKAETEFFKAHGLEVEPTSVRLAPEQVSVEFKQYEQQVEGALSLSSPPGPRCSLLDWLK